MSEPRHTPKVLIFDIETAPILAYVWKLWDENVGLHQIKTDWYVLSWSAKWLDDSRVFYKDQRRAYNLEDDKAMLKEIWHLLEEADIVVTQNGKRFDAKKLNARFIFHGFKPPKPYKHIDTNQEARRIFGFTSNSLEYMTTKLCKTHKKSAHKEFSGFDLWRECLAGNSSAWRAMEKYNKKDVLALEELYKILRPWIPALNFGLYLNKFENVCECGGRRFHCRGTAKTKAGEYRRYQCLDCGKWMQSGVNLLDKEQKKQLLR